MDRRFGSHTLDRLPSSALWPCGAAVSCSYGRDISFGRERKVCFCFCFFVSIRPANGLGFPPYIPLAISCTYRAAYLPTDCLSYRPGLSQLPTISIADHLSTQASQPLTVWVTELRSYPTFCSPKVRFTDYITYRTRRLPTAIVSTTDRISKH